MAESFFSSLKKERIKKQIYKNRESAQTDVADYIVTFYNVTFYNRTRRHSHLGGLSPEQFEAAHKTRRRGSPLNPGNSTFYTPLELNSRLVGGSVSAVSGIGF